MTITDHKCVWTGPRGFYDPTTSQFLSRDPLDAITRSAYGYVGNNPLNGTDPLGLYWGQGVVHKATHAVGGAAKAVVDRTVAGATYGVADCVRYVTCSSSTQSVGDAHPLVRDSLYVIAGGASLVASGGLLLGVAPTIAGGEAALAGETISAGLVGAFAATGDYGGCMRDHDSLACAGFAMGLGGALLGLFGESLGGVPAIFGLGIGVGGFTADLAELFEEAFSNGGCG